MPFGGLHNYKLLLILLIVPVQYLLTYFGTTDSDKHSNLQDVKLILGRVKNCLFFGTWKSWAFNFYNRFVKGSKDFPKEKIDDEIFKKNPKKEYFATSSNPRSPRPGHVLYRVGQVVRHRRHGIRGVIIGWDAKTNAPEMWIHYMYPESRMDLLKHPSYMILVDYRDTDNALRMYVNEVNIELVTGVQVVNNDVEDYFEYYNGQKYLLRPRLQKIYPED